MAVSATQNTKGYLLLVVVGGGQPSEAMISAIKVPASVGF